jgi:hypothetical protein
MLAIEPVRTEANCICDGPVAGLLQRNALQRDYNRNVGFRCVIVRKEFFSLGVLDDIEVGGGLTVAAQEVAQA